MITLLVEGQEIELPEEIAVSDDAIRKAIAPLFPQSANATIQRTTDGQGRTTIKLTKQAGTKGGYPEILKQLEADNISIPPSHWPISSKRQPTLDVISPKRSCFSNDRFTPRSLKARKNSNTPMQS